MRVLCLNVGSSSLKLALWDLAQAERLVARGSISGFGGEESRLRVRDADGHVVCDEPARAGDAAAGAELALAALERLGIPGAQAVGHRLVHGGPDHAAPERVTPALLAGLDRLAPFAPLHLPGEVAAVRALAELRPDLPQVVCFDTAFHRSMPEVAQRLPLPRKLWQRGVRRYGFHGLSYEYVVAALGAASRGRVVIAHLGNGASLAAVRDGLPVDTTMGLTPSGGLMMGTRSGDLDPGVLFHLARSQGHDLASLERLVDHESGLLGVSAATSDMQELLEARAGSPAAAQAVELFCYVARKHVAAMAAALGGMDTLVFTGGIGEHAAPVREEICAGLGHLGVAIDPRRNAEHAGVVSPPGSSCAVRVVPTDEERMIARHVRRVLAASGGAAPGAGDAPPERPPG